MRRLWMNRTVLAGGLAAATLLGLAAVGWIGTRRKPPAEPVAAPALPVHPSQQSDDLMLAARTKGDPRAPLVMYEVSDFQCPFCRQFWKETLPQLDREYIRTGKLRLTFINFPISRLHPNAPAAHEMAMCAAQQNRFWPIHDLLYRHQDQWARLPDPAAYFRTLADSAGLDRARLEACLGTGRVRQLVAAEADASWQAGVTATPSFIVQGVLLSGTAPIENFRPILDSLYRARTQAKPARPGP